MTGWAVALGIASFAHNARMERKAGKEAKKQQGKYDSQEAAQLERQKMLDIFGKSALGRGQENENFVEAYLRRLASGDRALTEQTLAPQINAMQDLYRGQIAAQRGTFPRGQGAAQTGMVNQQFQGGLNNLIFGARPEAMRQLGQLGGNQQSLGLQAMGQGGGLANSMLGMGLQAREQMFNQNRLQGYADQGWFDMANRLIQQYQNRPRNTLPATTSGSGSNMTNPPPTGWGSSSLGFNQQSPSSTYTPNNNPAGWNPYRP